MSAFINICIIYVCNMHSLKVLQFTTVPGDNHPCEIYPHLMNMKCSCSRSLPESLSMVLCMQERPLTFLPWGAANADK
jgi:hypothetical protein